MEQNKQNDFSERDFTTISPSARSLLFLKALTSIPYARQAAELISPSSERATREVHNQFLFWARVMHFENRYWAVDQLLAGLDAKNVLELSSGFSFRGLDMVNKQKCHYIDTDLPELIETKEKLVRALSNGQAKGLLEILPLNALDENRFMEVVSRFPQGELAIVNEGLLMYLDRKEKERLCGIIRSVLKQRGGCWITADIYIRSNFTKTHFRADDELEKFLERHDVEKNKFESFGEAEAFFKKEGLVIDKKATDNYSALTSFPHFMRSATEEQLLKLRSGGKQQEIWRLKLAAT